MTACKCPNCGATFEPVKRRAAKRQPLVTRPPSMPNDRTRMWQAMRILREFSSQSIAATSECSVRSARIYINALKDAAYVAVAKSTSFEVGDYTIYRLLENTGPHAPRLRSNGTSLFDPNTDKEVARDR